MRQYTAFDRLIGRVNKIIQAIPSSAPNESSEMTLVESNGIEADILLSPSEKAHSGALMRVNHCGEVSAQALYLGQALVARNHDLAEQLYHAANEEQVHLEWCSDRIQALGSRKSYLNPVWAIGSFTIGVVAGLFGDKISLGFMAETEKQVSEHLESHLSKISPLDHESKWILQRMKEDEAKHADNARELGGIPLPTPVQKGMAGMAKIMTTTAYYF